MIIDNVLYLFILFANLLAKAVPVLVYLYIIVYFLTKKVKLTFFFWGAVIFLPSRRRNALF